MFLNRKQLIEVHLHVLAAKYHQELLASALTVVGFAMSKYAKVAAFVSMSDFGESLRLFWSPSPCRLFFQQLVQWCEGH